MGNACTRESDDTDEEEEASSEEGAQEELVKKRKSPTRETPMGNSNRRKSVSAEAYGEYHKRSDFTPPVYAKSSQQVADLRAELSQSFLFYPLESKELNRVIMAMKGPIPLSPGQQIIAEGSSGEHLYVVADGILDCTKVIDGKNQVVQTCQKGDIFGQLALLYNAPRAASVASRVQSSVWELHRETFNNIVLLAVQSKRAQCADMLRKVPIFQRLSENDLQTVVDAMKMESFAQGQTIITQGEIGEHFYVVFEGDVVAHKVVPGQRQPVTMNISTGDYFGELALLNNERRAASVVAATAVRVLTLDRASFTRLMVGSAQELLRGNTGRYQ